MVTEHLSTGFEIKKNEKTGLFGIIKPGKLNEWVVKPTYVGILSITAEVESSKNLFVVQVASDITAYQDGCVAYGTASGILNADTGKLVLDCVHRIDGFPGEDLLLITADKKQNNKGLFSIVSEKILVPCKYDRLIDFDINTELIECLVRGNHVSDHYQGLIDRKTGEVILEPEFEFSVRTGNHFFLSSHPMQKIIQNKKDGKHKMGIIDRTGRFLLPVNFKVINSGFIQNNEGENSELFFYECINDNGKVGILDHNMSALFSFEYEELKLYPRYLDHSKTILVFAKKDNQWGIVDSDGKIRTSFKYELLKYIGSELFPRRIGDEIAVEAHLNSKKGIVTSSNKTLLPIEYSAIETIHGVSFFKVAKANKKGIIDMDSSIVIPVEYEDLSVAIVNGNYSSRFFFTKQNGLAGVYDVEGKVNIPAKYNGITYINYINDDNVLIQISQGKKQGLITGKDQPVVPPEYDAFWEGGLIKDVIGVQNKKMWGIVDANNKVILPCEYFSIVKNALPINGDILLRKEKGSAFIKVNIKDLIEKGHEKVLKTDNKKIKVNKSDELKLSEGSELIYEIGDFDSLDTYKIMLLNLQPQIIFSHTFKSEKDYKETSLVHEEAIKSSHALHEISQGSYQPPENACPFFVLSQKMYQELVGEGKTALTNLFAIKEGSYIKIKKEKKQSIKVGETKREILVLQAEIYSEGGGKMLIDGSIVIWKNTDFPLVISAEVHGEECSIKLKAII